jgi:hypothetical protein
VDHTVYGPPMSGAAVVGTGLLGAVAAFQVALALGAPWGRAAFGGQHEGTLPVRLRAASAVAGLVVYPLAMAAVLAAAGVIGDAWVPGEGVAVLWVLTGFFTLGTLVNAISRSPLERLWAPVSLAIAACCAIVAATG